MRRTASEKMEIITLVEGTELPVRATLRQLAIPKSTFYDWYQRFLTAGFDGYFVSESSVYRILKAADLITSPAYVLFRIARSLRGARPRGTGRRRYVLR